MITSDLRRGMEVFLQKTHLWIPVHFFVKRILVGLYKVAKIKLFEIDQKSYWSERSGTPGMDVQIGDPYYRQYDTTIMSEIGELSQCTTVLEVGCFTGKMLSQVWDTYPEKTITGCDLGRNQLLIFRNRQNNRDTDLIQCNAAYLPFKDNTFDLVFTSTCASSISPMNSSARPLQSWPESGKTTSFLSNPTSIT